MNSERRFASLTGHDAEWLMPEDLDPAFFDFPNPLDSAGTWSAPLGELAEFDPEAAGYLEDDFDAGDGDDRWRFLAERPGSFATLGEIIGRD